jgi:aryl-alcohol dehydrogenase-like predicted oxidoreductase
MKQRRLGKDGPMVGELGLGAMSFANMFGATDMATSHRALDKALELGITHVDTALIYGPEISENFIGAYFRKNPAAKKRISIGTKGGIVPSPRSVDNSAKFLRECLEGSLKRLGVDHVDLYYVHRRDHAIPIEDVTGTLLKFKDEGKIGGIGFSEISPASLMRAASVHHIMAVQNEYSLWTRLPELGLLQACKRLGTTLVAFSPLARGVLSDQVFDPAALPETDFRKKIPRLTAPHWKFNAVLLQRLQDFAKSRGWTTSALAIAWVLHQGDHIIPIPGTRTAEHLAEDFEGTRITLTAADLAELEEIIPLGGVHGNRYSVEQQGSAELYS